MQNRKLWIYWLIMVSGVAGFLTYSLQANESAVYLIGDMTHGHHQIELACSSCHTDAFGGGEVLQAACVECHAQDLKTSDDAHPKSKFTDPRNAQRLEMLDARYCVTCHTEHRPELTRAMGVTLPEDLCVRCHQDIAKDRPSHAGVAFSDCASAGCHNYHDNRALYEDFLLAHQGEPERLPTARLPAIASADLMQRLLERELAPLSSAQADVPESVDHEAVHIEEWAVSAHARSGVNCMDCHSGGDSGTPAADWRDKPERAVCAGCHEFENEGFDSGKHGMRLRAGLTPMTPAQARMPMHDAAQDQELDCMSCHGAHRFDTQRAAVDACMNCHDDAHTNNYPDSPHARLWQAESSGEAPAGSGVSCSSCHLPRTEHRRDGVGAVLVEHNQNMNLRPNEKMLRSVCMNCHGLGFSIDALADPGLVQRNFSGSPDVHVPSIDWAVRRDAEKSSDNQSTQSSTTTGDNP